MARFALIAGLLALTLPTLAGAEDSAGTAQCAPDAVCRLGGRLRLDAFSDMPWIAFLSADPFVRAIDACLGYVVTRDEAAWPGGAIESVEPGGMSVVLGDGLTRISFQDIRDDYFPGQGQLVCQYEGPPGRRMDLGEFWPWAELRLTAADGWEISDELRGQREFLRYRNAWIHATLRAYPTATDTEIFQLQLYYAGPPISFD
jgi:hypothetical protein